MYFVCTTTGLTTLRMEGSLELSNVLSNSNLQTVNNLQHNDTTGHPILYWLKQFVVRVKYKGLVVIMMRRICVSITHGHTPKDSPKASFVTTLQIKIPDIKNIYENTKKWLTGLITVNFCLCSAPVTVLFWICYSDNCCDY